MITSDIYFLLFILFLNTILSLALTQKMILLMTRFSIIDRPGGRRSHLAPTPRSAGVVLLFLYMMFFPIAEYCLHSELVYSPKILLSLLPIATISFLDDIKSVPITIRLTIHFICSAFGVWFFIYPFRLLHNTELILAIDMLIGIFALASFVNVYNFLDGIDGITASQSIHLSVTIIILCALQSRMINNYEFIIITNIIILGWSIGFLFFNWHPAKIFVGDVGSISLGFLFGLCLLMIAVSNIKLFAAAVIAPLYYIADGAGTVLIRLVNKEKIWEPHLKHFFQKAVKKGMSHSQVTLLIIQCNLALMILSIGSLYYTIICFGLAVAVVFFTLMRMTGGRYETSK